MLGMETARDEARLRKEISRARRTLSSRDAARQTKQVDDFTRMMQGEFVCDLLRGVPEEWMREGFRVEGLYCRWGKIGLLLENGPEGRVLTASLPEIPEEIDIRIHTGQEGGIVRPENRRHAVIVLS